MWNQLKNVSNRVVIEIKDGCCERFINLCRFNGIYMWDIHYNQEQELVTAKISKKDFMKIRQYVKKSAVHVRVKKKIGLGFAAFRYRKHYSFLVGIFLSLVLLKGMSLYVWNISFTGNTEYTNQMLDRFLNQQAYYVGMRICDINCDEIESSLRSAYEHITWVSAEISGTRLIIHMKENDGIVEAAKDETQKQSSIYASCDGIVTSMITRSGTPLVKVGDQVSAGDELVSGVLELHNDAGEVTSSESVGADATIVIRTEIAYADRVERVQSKKSYTGRTKHKKLLGISDWYVKLGIDIKPFTEYDCVTESDNLTLADDFCLPLWYGEMIYYEYTVETTQLSDEELEVQLKERLITYLHELEEKNVQICSNRVNMNIDNNSGIMEGIIEADVTEGSRNRQ